MTAQCGLKSVLGAMISVLALSCGGKPPPAYDTPPVLANRQEITDAMRAVGAGLETRVVLLVRVNAKGRVEDVRVAESSGDRDLDAAAEWIGEQMQFDPARRNGKPVAALVQVPVRFDVVKRVVRPPRIRNAEEVTGMMTNKYGDLEGTARFRIQVGVEGWALQVQDLAPSDAEVLPTARRLLDKLTFWPGYRGENPVVTWVDVVFRFGGPDSRVYIEATESKRRTPR